MSSNNIISRNKPSKECLSHWMISQLTLDLLENEKKESAFKHLHECERCDGLFKEETEQVKAAVYERVPDTILEAAVSLEKKPVKNMWMKLASAAAAACVILLVFIMLPKFESSNNQSGIRLKGNNNPEISVMRDNNVVFDQVPFNQVQQYMVGDKIRIHLPNRNIRWVMVEAIDGIQRNTIYKGKLPSDGWLPFSISITPEGDNVLRLITCENEFVFLPSTPLDNNGCVEREFRLKVQ